MPATIELVEIPCPLCGSRNCKFFLETVDHAHGIPGTFRLVRCRECRHVYLNPAPTRESLPLCYPADYAPHRDQLSASPAPTEAVGDTSRAERQPWYLSAPVRRIPGLRSAYYWLTDRKSQLLPPVDPAGRSALEIGCATGEFLARLQSAGWRAEGLDLIAGPVAIARGRGFEVHHGDLKSASYRDAQFDDVFAWMVVEHLPDPVESLREIARILKPGGWFCFSVPNFGSPERLIFGKLWHGYELPRHLQHYTVKRLRRLLSGAGLSIEKVVHQPCFLNWLRGGGLAMERWFPRLPIGRTLNRWFWDNPPLWTYFVLGPFARLQAALRMSGRITVLARKN
jgi:SAM-dependent methyltransferase